MTFYDIALIGADVRAMLADAVSEHPTHEEHAKSELGSRKPRHKPG